MVVVSWEGCSQETSWLQVQSLHTTVVFKNRIAPIKIRTWVHDIREHELTNKENTPQLFPIVPKV